MTKTEIRRYAKKHGIPLIDLKKGQWIKPDMTICREPLFNENLSKRNPWAWSPGPTKKEK